MHYISFFIASQGCFLADSTRKNILCSKKELRSRHYYKSFGEGFKASNLTLHTLEEEMARNRSVLPVILINENEIK